MGAYFHKFCVIVIILVKRAFWAPPAPLGSVSAETIQPQFSPHAEHHHHDILAFKRLNTIIQARSRRAELVIMNLPDIWDHQDPKECDQYVRCCESLVEGLDRVLFVHSSGFEIFNI